MDIFKDSAAGQLAGYLFQPDRALLHLSSLTNRNHSVSIEFTDDVSVLNENLSVILTEQDKHSISQSSSTFSNSSKDLWRTLEIWLEKIEAGILDPKKHAFICCTNIKISDSYLLAKINVCKDEKESNNIFDKLKAIQVQKKEKLEKSEKKASSAVTLSKIMDNVISKESILKELLVAIKLNDREDLERINDTILNNLNIQDDHPHKESILLEAKGWISERCKLLINRKAPVVLKKEDLNNFLTGCLEKFKLSNIVFSARTQIASEVNEEDVQMLMNNTFVEQLNKIKHRRIQDIILTAIIDFLCYQKEIVNIATLSNITAKDFEDFESLNKKRWRKVFDRYVVKELEDYTSQELDDFAYKIFDEVLSIEVKFKDFYDIPISSEYFKNGSYHNLANNLLIGWHPNWEKEFNVYEKTA